MRYINDPKDTPSTEPTEYENGTAEAEAFERWVNDEAEMQMEEEL